MKYTKNNPLLLPLGSNFEGPKFATMHVKMWYAPLYVLDMFTGAPPPPLPWRRHWIRFYAKQLYFIHVQLIFFVAINLTEI